MAKTVKHGTRERKASVSKQERLRHRRLMRVFGLFLALLLAFVAGFLVRSQPAFVASLGFSVGEDEVLASSKDTRSTYDSVAARVAEVEDVLTSGSLDGYDLGSATYGMLEALLASSSDPYAAYLSAERYAAYVRESTAGSYAGVGVLFAEHEGRTYVADVFEGSEAEAKGVMQGDFVVSIDGESRGSWALSEVLGALDREEGESVIIEWMRPVSLDAETGSEYATTLICQTYQVENVTTQLDGEVGYIRVRQFTQESVELVERAIADLSAEGAAAFVLDVRDNPGGYLTQAVDMASLFIPSGVVVEVATPEGATTKTASATTATSAPVVVLVNGYTSAAAEVLAASLQDNQRAEIVGATTAGKGSVQVVRELSFGGAIRYTAAYYRTPLGHDIEGVGITPDVKVSDADAQLRIAMETARSLA